MPRQMTMDQIAARLILAGRESEIKPCISRHHVSCPECRAEMDWNEDRDDPLYLCPECEIMIPEESLSEATRGRLLSL